MSDQSKKFPIRPARAPYRVNVRPAPKVSRPEGKACAEYGGPQTSGNYAMSSPEANEPVPPNRPRPYMPTYPRGTPKWR